MRSGLWTAAWYHKKLPASLLSRGKIQLALVEGCRHALEISIPAAEVESETGALPRRPEARQAPRLPARESALIIDSQAVCRRYPAAGVGEPDSQVRCRKQFEAENLNVVGTPDISDVHFHEGEPLRFKAEFEVVPESSWANIVASKWPTTIRRSPTKTSPSASRNCASRRRSTSTWIRGRWLTATIAVVALESVSGVVGEPVKQEEMVLEIGGADTFPAFTENLRGLSPGDEKEFEVAYPENYGAARLAGQTVKFHATVRGVRKKELPEVNDEFAQDLGDYRNLEELREAVRKNIFGAAAIRGPAGRQGQDRRQAGGRSTISRFPSLRRPADPQIAWSRACAP
jgi:trigger factor